MPGISWASSTSSAGTKHNEPLERFPSVRTDTSDMYLDGVPRVFTQEILQPEGDLPASPWPVPKVHTYEDLGRRISSKVRPGVVPKAAKSGRVSSVPVVSTGATIEDSVHLEEHVTSGSLAAMLQVCCSGESSGAG